MSRFVLQGTDTINLENGDWIKVPKELTLEEIERSTEYEGLQSEKTYILLEIILKEWNFKDEKGEDVPCNLENIKLLSANSLVEIANAIKHLLELPKAPSADSDKQSEEKSATKDSSIS